MILFIKNAYQALFSDTVDARTIKITRAFFFTGVLLLFSWFIYFSFSTIVIPSQIEYRQSAAQVMTQILLIGAHPCSLEYQPLAMNNYGVGYNLFVLPFAKMFGNTLWVHRGIRLFF